MTQISDNAKLQFCSDNASPICPEAWDAMAHANSAEDSLFAPAYGDDPLTERAIKAIQDVFETDCEVFFVFTGSAANALAISAMCQSYHGVLCHSYSHVENDEANAPEMFTGGAKLLHVDGADGKLDPAKIALTLERGHGIHSAKVRAITLTQSTEVGTVYTPDELRQITDARNRHPEAQFKFHMDGARFANAVAASGRSARELTWDAGIDVLSWGITKNGGPGSEALVFFDKELAAEFAWRRKQAGQLASKMRYVSAPWLGMLSDDVWLKNARHANEQARRLADGLAAMEGIRLRFPVQTNAVFAQLPVGLGEALQQRGWHFYYFPAADAWRLMCTWNTSAAAVDALLADIVAIRAAA